MASVFHPDVSPPYYMCVFTSVQTDALVGYSDTARQMVELAEGQPGYLGVDSARDKLGFTVSYWKDEESLKAWKQNMEHQIAQTTGKQHWYEDYRVHIAKVERTYGKTKYE